jgi:dihydroorotate dehydrogenase
MPDWTYRTLFRSPLMALPFRNARAIAFTGLGTLAKVPAGVHVVDFFGHMLPPRDLTVIVDGVEYRSPVGLGPQLDPQQQALTAIARFGVGWVEIDPAFVAIDQQAERVELSRSNETLHWQLPNDTSIVQREPLPSPALPVPQWMRISSLDVQYDFGQAAAITLNTLGIALEQNWDLGAWQSHLRNMVERCQRDEQRTPLYLVSPLQESLEKLRAYLAAAVSAGVDGFVVAPTDHAAEVTASEQLLRSCELIAGLRNEFGSDITIVAAAGVHSPADAIEAWRAGATLVQVDTGLIFAGPGLPKRINESRRFWQAKRSAPSSIAAQAPLPNPLPGVPGRGSETIAAQSPDSRTLPPVSRILTPAPRLPSPDPRLPSPALPRAVEQAWFWLLLLGLSMGGGGVIAWAIAATRVVLPYDEAYLDMTREQIAQINPRLLLFMSHDRITLAGTMLAIGVFYSFLAWHGVRRGAHWAWLTILSSALSGFASFFLFLFFGYFDPFHALVTAILFQLLLAGWQGKLDSPALPHFPNLSDTLAWKMSQWGQLLFVAQGVALIVGGCVISYVGSTTVFVHEDLEFMRTTREALLGLHPRLIPVVAHDRASFGGMLIANGLATLLSRRRSPASAR